MRGYITCKHCHGIGKIFKWWIFPKTCPYCNGLGDIWVDNYANDTDKIKIYTKICKLF
jgi:DnaJ-class molecular chaperone